jgi:hypothetical protein
MDPLLITIYVLLGCAALVALVFLLSQAQMAGWLKVADKFIGKKLTEYINNTKTENNERKKE